MILACGVFPGSAEHFEGLSVLLSGEEPFSGFVSETGEFLDSVGLFFLSVLDL